VNWRTPGEVGGKILFRDKGQLVTVILDERAELGAAAKVRCIQLTDKGASIY